MSTELLVLGLALLISFWLVWVGVRLLQKAGRSGGLCALTPRKARRLAFWHLAAAAGVPICVVVYAVGGHVGWAIAGPPAILLCLAAVVGRSRRESGYPEPVDTAAS